MAIKILVVDDEPDMVAIMKLTLEIKGFEVLTAYDAEEGFTKAKECCPGLVILDILMPQGFGDDLANRLNNDPETKNIPIIFFTNMPVRLLTGLTEKERHLSQDSKGNLYLQKSCTEEELLAAISQALRNK